jgi:hypothetical protein
MHLAKVGVSEAISQNSPAVKNPGLERSAHEFEASLMAELLKPLQETDGLTGEDNSGGGAGSGGALGTLPRNRWHEPFRNAGASAVPIGYSASSVQPPLINRKRTRRAPSPPA